MTIWQSRNRSYVKREEGEKQDRWRKVCFIMDYRGGQKEGTGVGRWITREKSEGNKKNNNNSKIVNWKLKIWELKKSLFFVKKTNKMGWKVFCMKSRVCQFEGRNTSENGCWGRYYPGTFPAHQSLFSDLFWLFGVFVVFFWFFISIFPSLLSLALRVFLVDTRLYPLPYQESSNRIPVCSQLCPRYSTISGDLDAIGLVPKQWKNLIPIPLSLWRSLLPALSCRVGLHRHHFRMNWYKILRKFLCLSWCAPVLTMRDFCVWGRFDPYCAPRPQDIRKKIKLMELALRDVLRFAINWLAVVLTENSRTWQKRNRQECPCRRMFLYSVTWSEIVPR